MRFIATKQICKNELPHEQWQPLDFLDAAYGELNKCAEARWTQITSKTNYDLKKLHVVAWQIIHSRRVGGIPGGELQSIQVPSTLWQSVWQAVDVELSRSNAYHTHLWLPKDENTWDLPYSEADNKKHLKIAWTISRENVGPRTSLQYTWLCWWFS